ncbi:MAG: TIGR02757 family protein, partial [Campylobacterales bacterium]
DYKENEDHILKEKEIEGYYKEHYYRFQSKQDMPEIFKAFSRIEKDELKATLLEGYKKENDMIDAINSMIELLYKKTSCRSDGCSFLYGRLCQKSKRKGASPYKRWNMFLRWMVRKDCLDLGRWQEVDRAHLLMPLDTHTFSISQKLGLLKRKTYDLESAYLLTQKLKEFDASDPLKYDFALYRIGQEGLI